MGKEAPMQAAESVDKMLFFPIQKVLIFLFPHKICFRGEVRKIYQYFFGWKTRPGGMLYLWAFTCRGIFFFFFSVQI